ncbi:MAG: phasin family protein [Endomicrobium sp.]|jgi:polyhydroxyalkanoate synthesis regulator phasin|nr:phasin family protein [Endomicrobium sp.]
MSNLKNAFYASVGLVLKSKDKIEAAAKKFVKDNKIEAAEGKKFIDKTVKHVESAKKDLTKKFNETVKTTVDKMGLITRKEVKSLKDELTHLKKQVSKPNSHSSSKSPKN